MSLDLAGFRAAYPEFSGIDDTTVGAKLALSIAHMSATAWAGFLNEAQGLETAHLLWNSPFGATMRLDSKEKGEKSRYQTELERLAARVIDSSCVVTDCARVR